MPFDLPRPLSAIILSRFDPRLRVSLLRRLRISLLRLLRVSPLRRLSASLYAAGLRLNG